MTNETEQTFGLPLCAIVALIVLMSPFGYGQQTNSVLSESPKTVNFATLQPAPDSANASRSDDLPLYEIDREKVGKLRSVRDTSFILSAGGFSEESSSALRLTSEFESPGSGIQGSSAVGLTSEFEGPDSGIHGSSGARPPDPTIAAGPMHVGVSVNRSVVFYTKLGVPVRQSSFSTFFAAVNPPSLLFQPRIAYDPSVGRWILVVVGRESGATSTISELLIATSKTSDPTGEWWLFKLNAVRDYSDQLTWAEFPEVGFDGSSEGAVYLTTNQFTFSANAFQTSVVYTIPKSQLFSGQSLTYFTTQDLLNQNGSKAFSIRPARTIGSADAEYMANTQSLGGDFVTLWKVVPNFPNPPTITRVTTITIASYALPYSAYQPCTGVYLDAGDNRISSSVILRNGFVHLAFAEAFNGWNHIRYIKINTSTYASTVRRLAGIDTEDSYYPAIAVDAANNVGLVYAASDTDVYASIRYYLSNPDADFQTYKMLKTSNQCNTGFLWGNYFSADVDPVSPNTIWIVGEWAKDVAGQTSEVEWGTWIGSNDTRSPHASGVLPQTSTVGTQTFELLFDDLNGREDIKATSMLISSALDGANACYVTQSGDSFWLANDGNTALLGPVTARSNNVIQNSQCILHADGSNVADVAPSQLRLSVYVHITFKPAFGGLKKIYLNAVDSLGLSSGLQELGEVAVLPALPPHTDLVSPASGSGYIQTFDYRWSELNGLTNLAAVGILINSSLNALNACYVVFVNGALQLANDENTAWIGPVAIGTPGVLENSQCRVDAESSTVTDSYYSTRDLRLAIIFKPAFAGPKNNYMIASDNDGLSSSWQLKGTWNVTLNQSPVFVSLFPTFGFGLSQKFSYVISDQNGPQDISIVEFLFNNTFNSANACFVRSSGDSLWLRNDGDAAWLGPMKLGSSASLQNSQCIVQGRSSAKSYSGSLLILELSLEFKVAFGGVKNQYIEATDTGGLKVPWVSTGIWSVPVCTFSISPSSSSFSPVGGIGTISMTTSFPVCPWTVLSNEQWLTINPSSGTGNTLLNFAVAANASTSPRSVNSSIGGQLFTVSQSGFSADGSPSVFPGWPVSGSGAAELFSFNFFDPNGASDLSAVNILINSALDGRQACYVAFVPTGGASGTLYLVNDEGSAGGPFATLNVPGTGTMISNSQCRVSAAFNSVGNVLTLFLQVVFSSSFAGNKVIYQAARDSANNNTGWVAQAVWNVPGPQVSSPSVVSMTPARGGGAGYPLQFVFSDPQGYMDLVSTTLLMNNFLDGAGACYLGYHRASNTVYLLNDAGNGYLPPLPLGGAGHVENSQCRIEGAGSGSMGNANNLTLTLMMNFKAGFAGNRVFYLSAQDAVGSSGWQSIGSWTVP